MTDKEKVASDLARAIHDHDDYCAAHRDFGECAPIDCNLCKAEYLIKLGYALPVKHTRGNIKYLPNK